MSVQQLQRGNATISHVLLVCLLPVIFVLSRMKINFQHASGGHGQLGHVLLPVARLKLLSFFLLQTQDYMLSVQLFLFKQEAFQSNPCQGRQYRTRAVSASYSGPDCVGPSYFVGGICPNIQVIIQCFIHFSFHLFNHSRLKLVFLSILSIYPSPFHFDINPFIQSFPFLYQSTQPCPTEKPGPRTLGPTERTAPPTTMTDTPGIQHCCCYVVMFTNDDIHPWYSRCS